MLVLVLVRVLADAAVWQMGLKLWGYILVSYILHTVHRAVMKVIG